MPDITAFFFNNIWLCIGLGALIIIIGDEVLGVSRALLSDPTDTLPYDKNIREQPRPQETYEPVDDFDQLHGGEDGPPIEDMLRPK